MRQEPYGTLRQPHGQRHLTGAIASSGLLLSALASGQAQVSPAVSADGKLQLYALPCLATTDDLADAPSTRSKAQEQYPPL
jgi:hypothetical protein